MDAVWKQVGRNGAGDPVFEVEVGGHIRHVSITNEAILDPSIGLDRCKAAALNRIAAGDPGVRKAGIDKAGTISISKADFGL